MEVLASNFDPDGPLAGFVVANRQPLITGTTTATRTEANVTTKADTPGASKTWGGVRK